LLPKIQWREDVGTEEEEETERVGAEEEGEGE
jgi:hypothetical protein